MTVTLELTPEVEARLRRKAESEGQDITAYLLAVAGREAQEESEEEAEGSAYDLFAEHIGRVRGSREALSQDTGARFTQGLIDKRDTGHL